MEKALKNGVIVDHLNGFFDNPNNNDMTKLLYGKCPLSCISELDEERFTDIMNFESLLGLGTERFEG